MSPSSHGWKWIVVIARIERPDVFGIAIRVTAVLSREFDSITTEGENGRDW
jgi:hypothetical protein